MAVRAGSNRDFGHAGKNDCLAIGVNSGKYLTIELDQQGQSVSDRMAGGYLKKWTCQLNAGQRCCNGQKKPGSFRREGVIPQAQVY